jgi:hypothetical protein
MPRPNLMSPLGDAYLRFKVGDRLRLTGVEGLWANGWVLRTSDGHRGEGVSIQGRLPVSVSF